MSEKRKRKPQTPEQKANRAVYMQYYRRGERPPKEGDEPQPTEAQESKDLGEPEVVDKPDAKKIADARTILIGIIQGGTIGLQYFWLPKGAPEFGQKRSELVADQWAPILAPYLNEGTQLAAAVSMTIAYLAQWRSEIKSFKEKQLPKGAVNEA